MANPKPTPDATTDEIGAPTMSNGNDTQVAPATFTRKLRAAVEGLSDGQYIDIRTVAERQQVSNLVGQIQKKAGVKFETTILRKRSEDLEGKLAIRVKRIGTPLAAKGAAVAQAQTAAE